MCGYACIGCGKCGKPKTLSLSLVCISCGTINKEGTLVCRACGRQFALPPGVAATRHATKH